MHDPRLIKSSSKILNKEELSSYLCPDCNTQHSQILIIGSYFGLMGAPLFPLDKTQQIHCKNCGKSTYWDEMSKEIKSKIKTLRKASPYPLHWYGAVWSFIALVTYVAIMYLRAQ